MADMAKDLELKLKITADGKVAASELDQVGDGVDRLGNEAKKAAGDTDLLKAGLTGVAAALSVDFLLGQAAELGALADEYNNMAGRLKLVAGEGAALAEALDAVRVTANTSGADLDATATLYTRLAQATKALGLSQSDVVGLTDTINKSFAVSGASAAEAEGAIRQFAQGLASGALRGDEFNSVMEQSPRLSQALADGLGVGIGQLRKMAEEGQLTAEVVTRALQSQAAAIEADFGKMPDTVARATQRLTNEWTVFIGKLDQTSGVTASISSGLNALAVNMDEIASVAATAGEVLIATFAVKGATAIRTYVAQMVTAAAASAAAANESARADGIKARAAATVAKVELEKARATAAATAATLAETQATQAAAAAAAIYGPQRAALERSLTAAKQANAAATAQVVAAESAYSGALAASTAQVAAATSGTTALAAAKSKLGGIVSGMGGLLKGIGYGAIVFEVMDLVGGLVELRNEYEKHDEILRDTVTTQDKVAATLARISQQTGVTVKSMADLDKAVESGQLHFNAASGTWDRGAENLDKVAQQAKLSKVELDKLAEAAEKNANDLAKSLADFGLEDLEQKLIDKFRKLAANPDANGSQILNGLLLTLDEISNERAPEVMLALRQAFDRKQIGLDQFEAGMAAAETKLQGLWKAANAGAAVSVKITNEAADAYERLGIVSQAAMQKAAADAKADYDLLVKKGVALADQAAAWKVYAEKAIAANGGVASSILQAEAAQHGLTIAIDESGKASIRTKEALEGIADAARRAAQEVAAANTAAMESAAIAASQARTSIGTIQGSIDGFVEHLHGMGTAVGSWVNAIRADMFAMSEAALESFNSMRAGVEGGTVGAYLEGLAKNAAIVTERFNQQAQVAEYWRQRLADGADTARDLDTATTVLGDSLNLLGNQQLDPLRAAIADAERRMLDLRDAAQSTLDSIQDEWDQLNNNLDEIERRRAEKREAEIKAQLAAAQASGDREAIADLQKSLQLLKDITAARIADAKQREKDAVTKTSTTSTTATPSASSGGVSGTSKAGGTVNLNINGLVTSSPREIAQALKPELDKLVRLGG